MAVLILATINTVDICAVDGVLADKSVVLLGDSNTWIGGDACDNPRGWNYWFAKETTPKDIHSYARSGATWSHTEATARDVEEYSEVITDNNVIYNQIMRLIRAIDNGEQISPDIILIAAGTNDAWFPQYRPEEFSQTADEVLRRDRGEMLSLPPGNVLSLAGAVRYDLMILGEVFPNAELVVMTPLQSVKISSCMLTDVSCLIESVALSEGAYVIRQDILCAVDRDAEMTRRGMTVDGTHTSIEGARRNAAVIAQCVKQMYAK